MSLPAITHPGQLVGRAGTSRPATLNYWVWPLIPSGFGFYYFYYFYFYYFYYFYYFHYFYYYFYYYYY